MKASLELDPGKYQRGMRAVERIGETAAARVQGAFARAGRALTSLPGLLTGGLIALTIRKVIRAANEQESAVADLNAALETHGNLTEAASKNLQDYASAMQRVTTYGDEEIMRAQAQLATFGMTDTQIKAVTKTTLDFAAAKRIDLAAAAGLVGKAFAGETSMLSRYGIILDENLSRGEKFTAALGKMSEMFSGRAAAAAETTAGRMAQLKNAFGDVQEKIGRLITDSPVLHGIMAGLTDVFTSAADASADGAKKTEEWQKKVEEWRGKIERVVGVMVFLWENAKAGAQAFFGGVQAAMGYLQVAWENLGDAMEWTWLRNKKVALGVMNSIGNEHRKLGDIIGDWWVDTFGGGAPEGYRETLTPTWQRGPEDALSATEGARLAELSARLQTKVAANEWWQAGAANIEDAMNRSTDALAALGKAYSDAEKGIDKTQKDAGDATADWGANQVEQFKKITEAMQKEFDAREKLLDKHLEKIGDLRKQRAAQAEGYEERVYGLITKNMSEAGKAVQAKGMSRTFYRRARGAADPEEQRRLLGKASEYAEQAGAPAQVLARLQRLTQQSFGRQEELERRAAQATADRMNQLQLRMAELNRAAQIKISLDTTEARAQLDDLVQRFGALRQPVPVAGGLSPAAAGVHVGTVQVVVSEKLSRGDIRTLVVDELNRLQTRGRI